jgi:hypothetical protein
MLPNFFKNKNRIQKTGIDNKEHNNRQNVNTCSRNFNTNRDRKQLNILEREGCRRIPGLV